MCRVRGCCPSAHGPINRKGRFEHQSQESRETPAVIADGFSETHKQLPPSAASMPAQFGYVHLWSITPSGYSRKAPPQLRLSSREF